MIAVSAFAECATCAAKPGSPTLCRACLHNRTTINELRAEREMLIKIYVLAARLRTFPVPFDDHFQLVGAVDACRSVLERRCLQTVASDAIPRCRSRYRGSSRDSRLVWPCPQTRITHVRRG